VKVTANKIRRVVTLLLDQHHDLSCDATDYANVLVSINPLMKEDTAESRIVNYYSEGQTEPTGNEAATWQKTFTVIIQYESKLSVESSLTYVGPKGSAGSPRDKHRLLTALNLLFSRQSNQNSQIALIGKSRQFDIRGIERTDLGGGLIALLATNEA
jgi:hypothetical protein